MATINPTEDQFSNWMAQYYPPQQPSRRLSDLALSPQDQAALMADLQQTQDPENAAIMQQMAQQQAMQTAPMVRGNTLSALAQPQAMNTAVSSSGRTIDLGYAAPGGSGVSHEGFKTKADPWVEGPRELSRKQLRDGTMEVIREYPALDGFGRQSSKLVREIETPAYLNPAEMKRIEYQTKVAAMEKAQADAQDAMGMPVGGGSVQPRARALERTYGKPQPGYRWAENGTLEAIPGGPADQKAQQKAAGATDVDIALTTLRDAYDRLETGGGITSTTKGPIDNLTAAVQSSGIGQAAGKAFGTANQSARNDVAMSRPALLAALMKATGMNAKQMDSNAELKLWLTTATDPTLDVQSNRRALDNIEKKYLGGNTISDSSGAGNKPAVKEAQNGANTVALPDGRTLRFPSGAAAEAFRRKAGL